MNALRGIDCLGADSSGGLVSTVKSWFSPSSSGPTYVMAFTDKNTVRDTQQAIYDYNNSLSSKVPQLDLGTSGPNHNGVDGVLGGHTSTAVNYINTVYGADPSAGPNITVNTLIRLDSAGHHVDASANPVSVKVDSSSPSPVSTNNPSANYYTPPKEKQVTITQSGEAPGFFENMGIQPWQVGVGAAGVLAITVGILFAFEK